jgi:hypothetical protein
VAGYGRILTRWAGGPSAPGLTVMNVGYGSTFPTQAAVDAVRAFWDSLKALIPAAYTLTVDPLVENHAEATGVLLGTSNAATAPAAVAGTVATAWAAGVGMRINWETGAVVHGHRVRGRTFVVPIGTANYDATGTITNTVITSTGTAIATLLSALNAAGAPLCVYTATSPKGAGVLSTVTSGAVPDEVAVLSGRRRP